MNLISVRSLVKSTAISLLAVIVLRHDGYSQNTNTSTLGLASAALAPPIVSGNWVRPAQGKPAEAVWGHAKGLRVGIPPVLWGPRGLLRIYTPYIGNVKGPGLINFIAMEPVPEGTDKRGYSEMEKSSLDTSKMGKRFWSANDSLAYEPKDETYPADGIVEKENGREILSVYIFCEPFENGTKVYVRLRFDAGKPNEVEIQTFRRNDSKPLKSFVLTATMGNYARLRKLYLADDTVYSRDLWPGFTRNAFTQHAVFPASRFIHAKNHQKYFVATTNEIKPAEAAYQDSTHPIWRYDGRPAVQYWSTNSSDTALVGQVNGRCFYWASKNEIPGGIAFENFELKEPFRQGASFIFGVVTDDPKTFIKKITK